MNGMKILNLYAGIGGNRKLWGDEHKVTAVEYKPEIAAIYKDLFPNDEVIVGDAHDYLLKHYKEYDFIWSSPPCPSHSKLRKDFSVNNGAKVIYPDMKLYEEILLLQGYFKGKFAVENVISWYDPLIMPHTIDRHYYWTNFYINKSVIVNEGTVRLSSKRDNVSEADIIEQLEQEYGYDLSKYRASQNKIKLMLRNCVQPRVGLHILQEAFGTPEHQESVNKQASLL